MMRYSVIFTFVLILTLSLAATGIQADVLDLPLTFEFSGATPPQGTSPWITARFNGGAPDNTVRLTMEATNLVGTEFVHYWLFNFDPLLDPTQLSFTVVNNSASVPDAIGTGVDAFQADGDGLFDIGFEFPTAGGTGRFNGGETVIYDLTYIAAISASSFNYLSAPNGGGHGPYKSVAHVQGISDDRSGWIADDDDDDDDDFFEVPEPSTLPMLLLGGGLCGLLGLASYGKMKLRRRKE